MHYCYYQHYCYYLSMSAGIDASIACSMQPHRMVQHLHTLRNGQLLTNNCTHTYEKQLVDQHELLSHM